jgi:hypothetical protein
MTAQAGNRAGITTDVTTTADACAEAFVVTRLMGHVGSCNGVAPSRRARACRSACT